MYKSAYFYECGFEGQQKYPVKINLNWLSVHAWVLVFNVLICNLDQTEILIIQSFNYLTILIIAFGSNSQSEDEDLPTISHSSVSLPDSHLGTSQSRNYHYLREIV